MAIEASWYAGENDESIDMTGTSTMLTEPLPDSMPYAVMFDEDCGGLGQGRRARHRSDGAGAGARGDRRDLERGDGLK